MRAVIYARYSSELQRDASIEDQVRVCRRRIEAEGWSFQRVYADHVRIPTKPATYSNMKPATCSDLKPAGIPISSRPPSVCIHGSRP